MYLHWCLYKHFNIEQSINCYEKSLLAIGTESKINDIKSKMYVSISTFLIENRQYSKAAEIAQLGINKNAKNYYCFQNRLIANYGLYKYESCLYDLEIMHNLQPQIKWHKLLQNEILSKKNTKLN